MTTTLGNAQSIAVLVGAVVLLTKLVVEQAKAYQQKQRKDSPVKGTPEPIISCVQHDVIKEQGRALAQSIQALAGLQEQSKETMEALAVLVRNQQRIMAWLWDRDDVPRWKSFMTRKDLQEAVTKIIRKIDGEADDG